MYLMGAQIPQRKGRFQRDIPGHAQQLTYKVTYKGAAGGRRCGLLTTIAMTICYKCWDKV